jgi:predicted dehydrogenase
MRVALLEASHWHVPLYLGALEAIDVQVVAVSDRECASGPAIAGRFAAKFYEDYADLLDSENLDFAFVFGRHCDVGAMASTLIERGTPFSLEKPCGLNAHDVARLNDQALAKNVFVSVPLIFRISALRRNVFPLKGAGPRRWDHMSFKFIAGPPERYIDAGCSWMLDKSLAGGGCSINLAVHFIDLVTQLTGEDIASISAQMLQGPGRIDVEVFSAIALTTTGGTICNIETGYTYPGGTEEQREFSFSLSSDCNYIRSREDGFLAVSRDRARHEIVKFDLNTDEYYADFVHDSLRRASEGGPPSAGLSDMERVMQVIDCAYASAQQGGVLVPNKPDRTAISG